MAKFELTKSIINENACLIGFIIKGKDRDLGGFGDAVVEKPIQVEELKTRKFLNKQIDVTGGQIRELGKFKLNSLPMLLFNNNGNFTEVDNGISLTSKYVQDNKIVGFDVKFNAFNGGQKAFSYNSVIALGKWFKQENFVIKHSDKGNKSFISGKGMSLEDLPTIAVGEQSKAKKRKSGAVSTEKTVSGRIEREFDILDVYDVLSKFNGQVIHLPGENYVPVSIDGMKVEEGFTSLGIGEVASPNLKFNSVKMNVNAGFKKAGAVPVTIKNKTTNIVTFIYRTKSLFAAGESYVKKFGVAVPVETESALVKELGASLTLKKLTDNTIIQPLSQVIDAKALSFYTVDATGLDLISKSKRSNSILSADKIATLCKKRYSLKIVSKYCKEVIKDIKKELGDDKFNTECKGKEVFSSFAFYSPEILEELKRLGFDIYTGAYSNTKSEARTGKSNPEADKVEIIYAFDGCDDTKKTGAIIKKAVENNNADVLDTELLKKLRTLYEIASPYERNKQASSILAGAQEKLENIEKKLWMHTASMFIEGGKTKVHSHDANDWVPVQSRAKNYDVYASTKVTGLTVKIKGLIIG
jgi:hypothetical protein